MVFMMSVVLQVAEQHHVGGAIPPAESTFDRGTPYFQAFADWHGSCFQVGRKEGKKMKKTIAVMMLLAGGMFAAPRIAVGINFGAPAPVAVVRPVCPGPGYVWVNGYYGPNGGFVAGYWAPPVVRVAPRFDHARVIDRDHGFDHFRR
jgi:hypothetical protein